MYRNKKDVDKHVDSLQKKLSPKEFKSRAYSIARLYYDVGDYSNCMKYVDEYLTQKDKNAAAYKLLGQALLKLGQKNKALDHFITSLEIDPTQTSLILDICDLLADHQVEIDVTQASYWCDKAQGVYPRHPTTFRLRERLVGLNKSDPQAVIQLLQTQLKENPKDPFLHARLLKHYINSNNIKEAFEHAYNVEFESNTFSNNIAWYESLMGILKQNTHNIKDWKFQLFLLTVRERICYLSITETPSGTSKSIIESNELLHLYDQAIDSVAKAGPSPGYGEFHVSLIQHHKGQLACHIATYLLKKAKKEQLNWRDATRLAAPLFLISWQTVPIDPKVNWLSHAPEKQKDAALRWYLEGSYRCSQSGHYLVSNLKDKSQSFLDNVAQLCSDANWRVNLYEKIFTSKDQLAMSKSSYLVSKSFTTPMLRFPRKGEVVAYDLDAQKLYANSIHHMVWMLFNYTDYSQFQCTLFQMLKPSTANQGPESLNKLDVDAFLYCTALTAYQKKTSEPHIQQDKPLILPASITELLCTLPQMKWWVIALKFAQNELGTDWTDVRITLGRGIEVIRCMDNHGLDPELLCQLGNIFCERAKCLNSALEHSDLEARAAVYYKEAIPILEKLKNKIFVKVPDKRMFDYTSKDLSDKQITLLFQKAKLCVALNYLKDSEYEKSIEVLSNLKSPQAYYIVAKSYMNIAVEKVDSSVSSRCSLLTEAKNFADKALSKVKDTDDTELCKDVHELIETIETHLSKTNMDLSSNNINKIDGDNSPEEQYYSINTSQRNLFTMHRNHSSTPKQTNYANNTKYRSAIDSHLSENNPVDYQFLERIENQIKNLQRRETTINDFMDQTRDWFDENRRLGNQIMNSVQSNMQNTTDQFKLLKISVDQIKDQLDECKNECKDVSDLKKQLSELKKEVNKLKKTSSEQTIDDSDIYNLEEDFRSSENNLNLPFNPTHVMPNFNQRLLPTFPIPPYQIYGQNMMNLYNQYSQFAQPPPVPGAPQMFDPSRTPVNYPGMYPTPEQFYLDVAHLVPPVAQPATSVPIIPPIQPVSSLPPVTTAIHGSKVAPPPQATTVSKSAPIEPRDSNRSLPVNVVITSSDPLPSRAPTGPAPILSVTIPPKHIKGTPHNYQIALPSEEKGISTSIFSTPTVIKSTTTTASSTINWNPVTNFQTNPTNTFDMFSNNFKLNNSKLTDVSVVDGNSSYNTSLNKSRTLSEKSNTSVENYDPCPDFKPIIPLPAEVKVTTGEEDETVIFSARAKLFRFANKEWKERGLGDMKLLKHKMTGKVRVLMRREQIHKICANHIITSDMEIKPMLNETKAYFWVANDFADETVVLEKFCVRFKTPEIALKFFNEFEKARKHSIVSENEKAGNKTKTTSPNMGVKSHEDKSFSGFKFNSTETKSFDQNKVKEASSTKSVVGGFTFTSTPTFKPVVNENNINKESQPENNASNKLSVFDNLSFKTNNNSQSPFSNLFSKSAQQDLTLAVEKQKINTSDTIEEFEPNVEFKPVVPLPALIDQKTGEEDENVLFEHRAKLLRFDNASKEWKERGLGNMKLLMQKENDQKIRLLMRREQIMKVCCNHVLTKDMTFQKMPNMDKAVTWCAKDFSEGELVAETFCLRFKTVQVCDEFINAIKLGQSKLKDESKTAKEVENAAKQSNQIGFGDKFKPKSGTWHCDSCYTNNLENFLNCACCEQPKPKQDHADDTNTKTSSTDWGDKFKPKAGSWECQQCFIRNDSTLIICSACSGAKDPSNTKPQTTATSDNLPKFSFGIPTQQNSQTTMSSSMPITNALSGWGDKFKPKEGSWECKQCFVRNEGSLPQCSACSSPRDSNSKANNNSSVLASTQGKPFSFGIPSNSVDKNTPTSTVVKPSIFDGTGAQTFSFGIPKNPQDKSSVPFTGAIFASTGTLNTETSLNFSLNKDNANNKVNVKPALLSTPVVTTSKGTDDEQNKSFGFVFKPKTPPKSKSPGKSFQSPRDDESDGYASEDEGHHIHFSPIIPLPDKIEVVTGEENEDELYGHRAKLFIFTSGEWKERGIGIVKILKHKETGKLRVVMRREQVLKICLNHSLTGEISYTPKDNKTWLFAANDFSEGEINLQQFCLRFKTKEIAQEFKQAVDNARGHTMHEKKDNISGDDTSENDVVFVSETQASAEEQKKAKDLMLPENFFTYKDKVPCQGCRGCTNDDDDVSVIKPSQNFKKILSTATSTPVRLTPPKLSQASSAMGTPCSADKTFMGDTSIYRTPLGSALGLFNTKQSPSSNSTVSSINDATDKENKDFIKNNLFQVTQKFESPQSNSFDSPQTITSDTSTDHTKGAEPSAFGSSIQKTSDGVKNTEAKSVFGSLTKNITEATKSADSKPMFGSVTQKSTEEAKNLDPKSVFGSFLQKSTESAQAMDAKPGFGTLPQKAAAGSIFSTNTSSTLKKPFTFSADTTKDAQKNETQSVFGSESQQSTNLFSSLAQGSIFGSGVKSNTLGGSIFGAAKFGVVSKPTNDNVKTESKDFNEPIFKVENNLYFSDLATKESSFQKTENFKWEGEGQPLFGGVKKATADDSGAAAEEEYDPYYEPIVPLPDKIVVTTGEEDEEKIYGERCKLYRFDEQNTEWKERGVGELKILYHPEKKTYRLLMRREQIHKAVLNMLLHMDMEFLPMKNSDRAWTWAGRNFAESAAGEQETLAVRFKSVDLAQGYYQKATECIRKLQSLAAQALKEKDESSASGGFTLLRLPKHLQDNARADGQITQRVVQLTQAVTSPTQSPNVSTSANSGLSPGNESYEQYRESYEGKQEEHDEDDDYDYEHNDEYDYEEEEEESTTYYTCAGAASVQAVGGGAARHCGRALVQVSFDPEIYSPKILLSDEDTGEILADMLIHTETEFQVSGSTFSWAGTDFTSNDAREVAVTVTLPDDETAMTLFNSCETSKAATYSSTDPES